MTKVLLTGSTGLMGASLLVRFLSEGLEIVAPVRGASNEQACERLEGILSKQFEVDDIAPPTNWQGQLKVVAGDISNLDALLETLLPIKNDISYIWHCAACTNFIDQLACEEVNFEGTKNMIALATQLEPQVFHHVSTAYVSGGYAGLVNEDSLPPEAANNAYEATKYKAERLLRESTAFPWTISRPSIIVGNRNSGKSREFKNFYLFLKYFTKLARREGRLPLRLYGDPENPINLVPLDFVVDAAWTIHQKGEVGKCYNLVNVDPPSLGQILASLDDILNVTCLDFAPKDQPLGEEEAAAITRFQEFLPYIFKGPRFDVGNLRQLYGDMTPSTLPKKELDNLVRVFVEQEQARRRKR